MRWETSPPGSPHRNGSAEAFVKKLKDSLKLHHVDGMDFVELQATVKDIYSVLNTRPIYARYGPKNFEDEPDFLELISPSMLLMGKSGIDLPFSNYNDEKDPARRLTQKEKLVEAWWTQWIMQCFDSLFPTKDWNQGGTRSQGRGRRPHCLPQRQRGRVLAGWHGGKVVRGRGWPHKNLSRELQTV